MLTILASIGLAFNLWLEKLDIMTLTLYFTNEQLKPNISKHIFGWERAFRGPMVVGILLALMTEQHQSGHREP